MKFAFSTLCAPQWDFETFAAKATEYGYDGLEIRGFLNESILTAANVFLSDPAKVRAIFHAAHVEIACLSSSVMMSGKKSKDRQAADDLRRYIDTAVLLGCPLVKIADTQVRAGQSRDEAAASYARWLAPLGDYAAERNITILIENLLSFRNSKELWTILEMLSHPSIACCWDLFNAAVIGEPPSVSVPTLNYRIQYTQVKDATLGPLGASFCKLGDGNARVYDFIKRLKGIGYTGYICFEWEKAWLPNLAGEPEEMLPHALGKLREWTKPQIEEEEAPAPKAEKTPAAAAAAAH